MAGEDQPSSATLGYLAPICVAVFFIFVWILVGTRHRFLRNDNGPRPMDPESWALGYGHVVLTSGEIDTQFPLMKYSTWSAETHKGNLRSKELNGTDPPVPNSPSQSSPPPSSPTPSLKNNHSGDDKVAGRVEAETAGTTGPPATLGGDSHSLCAICMELFDDEDSIRSLTCGHIFHAACLDPWFTKRQARCPLCKTSYPPERFAPDGTRILYPSSSTRIAPPAAVLIRGQILPRLL